MNLTEQCEHVRSLKLRASELKHEAEDAAREFKLAERELLDRFEAEGAAGHRTEDGVLFTKVKTIYSKIADRDAFVAWAEEHEPELLKTDERKGLVHELVRERLDNGEDLPPGVDFRVDEYISQRAG